MGGRSGETETEGKNSAGFPQQHRPPLSSAQYSAHEPRAAPRPTSSALGISKAGVLGGTLSLQDAKSTRPHREGTSLHGSERGRAGPRRRQREATGPGAEGLPFPICDHGHASHPLQMRLRHQENRARRRLRVGRGPSDRTPHGDPHPRMPSRGRERTHTLRKL